MKHNKNITKICMATALGVLAMISGGCNDKAPEVPDEFDVVEPSIPSLEAPITVTGRALILSGDGVCDNLRSRFVNQDGDINTAAVIVVPCCALEENSDAIMTAYQRGALIVVDAPDGPTLQRWCGTAGITYGASVDADMRPNTGSVVAFNRSGRFYFQDTPPSNNNEIDIPDDDVPLNCFSRWVNRTLTLRSSTDARSTYINRRFTPQEFTHTFNVAVNAGDLERLGWSAPANTRRSTTVDVTMTIYPVHVFDGPATGDIYFVDAQTTIYNSDIYNGIWQRRRGTDVSRLCGFYMNRLLTGAVLDAPHRYLDGCSPVPGNAPAGQEYAVGFDWEQQCLLAGGVDTGKAPMTASEATWIWKKQNTDVNDDIDISLLGNAALMADIYGAAGSQGHQHTYDVVDVLDNSTLEIAPAATSDLTFRSSWAWFVSDADIAAAKQGDEDPSFVADIAVLPFYQTYISTGGRLDMLNLPAGTGGWGAVSHSRVRLVAPPRKP